MLDLLIMDIDNSFIPHRTVDAGYRLFLKNLSRMYCKDLRREEYYTTSRAWIAGFRIMTGGILHMRPKGAAIGRVAKLAAVGFYLHALYLRREATNRYIRRQGSERLIGAWVKAVIGSGVRKDGLYPGKGTIERSLDRRSLAIYGKIREENPGMRVIAISQNFVIDKDPIKEILSIDEIHSNRFLYNKRGIITGHRVRGENGRDKGRTAGRLVKEHKARRIGVIVEDYDDLELLEMKGVALAVCSRKIRRFIRNMPFERIELR